MIKELHKEASISEVECDGHVRESLAVWAKLHNSLNRNYYWDVQYDKTMTIINQFTFVAKETEDDY
jgi:hypothetical protein